MIMPFICSLSGLITLLLWQSCPNWSGDLIRGIWNMMSCGSSHFVFWPSWKQHHYGCWCPHQVIYHDLLELTSMEMHDGEDSDVDSWNVACTTQIMADISTFGWSVLPTITQTTLIIYFVESINILQACV